MDEMQEIMDDFFAEADESLDELEQDLIKLETACESDTYDSDLVDRIFRVLHTLKGGAGFLGLEYMAKLAHAGENLLDEVRANKVEVTTRVMDALLKTNDLLKELLEIEKTGGDASTIQTAEIVVELESITNGEAVSEKPLVEEAVVEKSVAEEPVVEEVLTVTPEKDDAPAFIVNEDLLAEIAADDRLAGSIDDMLPDADEVVETETSEVVINEDLLAEIAADDRLTGSIDDMLPNADEVVETETSEVVINEDLLAEIAADDRLAGSIDDMLPDADEVVETETSEVVINEDLLAEIAADDKLKETIEEKIVEPKEAKPVEEEKVIKRGEGSPEERRDKGDRRKEPRRVVEKADVTIRVETGKIDKTMNLVGELVSAKNSLMRYLNLPEMREVIDKGPYIGEVMTSIEHLSQVTKDLQLTVLSTRMQPIKKVFDKIPRQVRDLKTKLAREVDIVIEGEFTEVDKSLVEELSDPMVHLIRNSLDHGIETPDDREAVGKSRIGTLKISAFYEGNKVVIQVQDDGAGIDPEKIRDISVNKGMINRKEADTLSDEDAVKLIMAAGFSTASEISDVSGRGVGMDVVNSSIQAVKGTVDIVSEFGVGTTISIYLPLTLAIVQALVVKSNFEGFAIPIGDINEVIKFNPEDVHQMSKQDVIELRGAVLPLFHLKELTSGVSPNLNAVTREVEGRITTEIVEDTSSLAPKEGVNDTKNGETEAKVPQKEDNNSQGYVVVVKEGRQTLGLVVEELIGQEEAVIKALGNGFEYHKAISGATITGDGTVHMILDVPYLIKEITKK